MADEKNVDTAQRGSESSNRDSDSRDGGYRERRSDDRGGRRDRDDRGRGRFRDDRRGGRDRDRGRGSSTLDFRPLEVPVINGNLEGAIRALKRKMNREGILKQLKLKRFYEKPSVRKKRKRKEAERRRRRLLRRLAKRMAQRKRR